MIHSMTGWGKSIASLPGKSITIEIKALNSKGLDFNTRLPQILRDKELEIRNDINSRLHRGKIDLYVTIEASEEEKAAKINTVLMKDYFRQIKKVADELRIEVTDNLLAALSRYPDVLLQDEETLSEAGWLEVKACLNQAMDELIEFRSQEGNVLSKDFRKRVMLILEYLNEISKFEGTRIKRVRERLKSNLTEFISSENIDQNRLEQEIIYYLEKYDVTEEKVRLKNHCDYFIEILKNGNEVGKKLNFIAQEMQREINTLGSKANDSDMQKLVVAMKDELEKIKEQLMNVV